MRKLGFLVINPRNMGQTHKLPTTEFKPLTLEAQENRVLILHATLDLILTLI